MSQSELVTRLDEGFNLYKNEYKAEPNCLYINNQLYAELLKLNLELKSGLLPTLASHSYQGLPIYLVNNSDFDFGFFDSESLEMARKNGMHNYKVFITDSVEYDQEKDEYPSTKYKTVDIPFALL